MRFYLGAHRPTWLELTSVPLFVSKNAFRLERGRRSYPRAAGPWALDSGGFTELSLHARWKQEVKTFAKEVQTIQREVGNLVFAAPQDWMCEPQMVVGGSMKTAPGGITPGTGLSVGDHQYRTIHNLIELRSVAPEVPWIPVLQGWAWGQYIDHLEAYDKAGIDLRKEPLVGLGSVCRRQDNVHADTMIWNLARAGLRLHAFGFNTPGLLRVGKAIASSDSMAWSYAARQRNADPSDRNDLMFALQWRANLIARLRTEGVKVT